MVQVWAKLGVTPIITEKCHVTQKSALSEKRRQDVKKETVTNIQMKEEEMETAAFELPTKEVDKDVLVELIKALDSQE
ncbi:hypothetical protein MKW98_008436 [Papaver atlanticum]|uniref:Uncharacterized protein n=1 Tax=Papaver atlanticum TaxID=357466 RepID=A0AAD4SH38_9MAGN|nr:hypothetical protein MKW98_008436 [Papaver atlanticum]